MARAVPKRMREFAAGRQCAHRLLAELGAVDAPLLVGRNREPLWPPDIVGSITHTEGMCAAVAARRTHLGALGIDAETADAVKEELFAPICTDEELEWLRACAGPRRALMAALIFSAKEAFHKGQFSMTGEWLGFEDVAVELDVLGSAHGEFVIRPQRALALSEHQPPPWSGRFLFDDRYVVTGVGLSPARAGTAQ